MNNADGPALQIALAYYRAWTSHDIDLAMTYIDPDIVCDAPVGRLDGADAYRAFMTPFTKILVSCEIIAAFGDEQTAMIMYDTETVPVKRAPGAECVTVVNGRITRSWFLFDSAPFDAARKAGP